MQINHEVLRTVYIPPDLDDRITEEMRVTGFSRNELIVEYLLLGMLMHHLEAKGTF